MAASFQTTFSNAFYWMNMLEIRLKFHLRVQLTIVHNWFRWWLCADQATSHYLYQWWYILLTQICVTRPQWVRTAELAGLVTRGHHGVIYSEDTIEWTPRVASRYWFPTNYLRSDKILGRVPHMCVKNWTGFRFVHTGLRYDSNVITVCALGSAVSQTNATAKCTGKWVSVWWPLFANMEWMAWTTTGLSSVCHQQIISNSLTRLSLVPHIWVGERPDIGSGYGLSPVWCQAMTWTNTGIDSIVNWALGNKLQWTLSRNTKHFFHEMYLKMQPEK